MSFKFWPPLVRVIPKEVAGVRPKATTHFLSTARMKQLPFQLYLCARLLCWGWQSALGESLLITSAAHNKCSRIQVSSEICRCFLGVINEHRSVSSAAPGQALAGHGQQAASVGRLGGSQVQGQVLLGWIGSAHMGVLSPCLLWGETEGPLCPFCDRFFSPCLWKPLPVLPQTNSFTWPCLNSRCSQLCLCKCLKNKQWVSTLYSRHFTEKKQRTGYIRENYPFNAQLNEHLQKALSTRICKGAIKAEDIVLSQCFSAVFLLNTEWAGNISLFSSPNAYNVLFPY